MGLNFLDLVLVSTTGCMSCNALQQVRRDITYIQCDDSDKLVTPKTGDTIEYLLNTVWNNKISTEYQINIKDFYLLKDNKYD